MRLMTEEREIKEFMLSTSDNPYNPFTDFKNWFNFDVMKGYNTCQYLDKICEATDDLGDRELALSLNEAIEEALYFNLTGNRIKVEKPKDLDEQTIS
jgi:hypothetical protein